MTHLYVACETENEKRQCNFTIFSVFYTTAKLYALFLFSSKRRTDNNCGYLGNLLGNVTMMILLNKLVTHFGF